MEQNKSHCKRALGKNNKTFKTLGAPRNPKGRKNDQGKTTSFLKPLPPIESATDPIARIKSLEGGKTRPPPRGSELKNWDGKKPQK